MNVEGVEITFATEEDFNMLIIVKIRLSWCTHIYYGIIINVTDYEFKKQKFLFIIVGVVTETNMSNYQPFLKINGNAI
jgi:hypothetical protein